LLELVHTKNVIELSVLHFERDGRSTQEYELTRNDSMRLKNETVFSRSRFLYSGQRLIFHVAAARGDWGIRRLASMWNDRRGSADTVHVSVGRRDAGITAKAGLIQINDQMRDRTLASNKPPHPTPLGPPLSPQDRWPLLCRGYPRGQPMGAEPQADFAA
jgi:hypothetical protein